MTADSARPIKIAVMLHGPLRPGARFGRYELVSRLAVGGMAEVWLAVSSGAAGFRKRVAVKTVLPELAASQTIVELFVREASLCAELSHPNIVQVFDFGELDGRYFMVMEYVAGPTLRDVLGSARELRQLPPLWFLLRTLSPVCDALQYLHEAAVVHLDLSPENIMVTLTGGSKLIDFGAAGPLGTSMLSGAIVGKFRYVAPERLEGGAPDGRSDVYSLGIILYELTTGVKPFDGGERAVLSDILRGAAPDPRAHNPALSAELAAIISRAMARNPGARYPHVRALRADLLRTLPPGPIDEADVGMYVNNLFPRAEATPQPLFVGVREALPEMVSEQVVLLPPQLGPTRVIRRS